MNEYIFLVNVILHVLSSTVFLFGSATTGPLIYLPQKNLLKGKLEYEVMKSKGGLHGDICDVFDYTFFLNRQWQYYNSLFL